jgi:hypothetical protein
MSKSQQRPIPHREGVRRVASIAHQNGHAGAYCSAFHKTASTRSRSKTEMTRSGR